MDFPKNYFKTEVRDSFEVDELMKRAWAAAVEVLEVVDAICRKHHLKWFADWGTLLGAVRHKGFIPWDDDIDIAMLRKDYRKLIEVLPDELPEGFQAAGIYAQDEYMRNAAKVQQLRVIADDRYWTLPSYMNRFHGFPCFRIGIDIFPLDNVYPDKEKDRKIKNLYFDSMNLLTHWDTQIQGGKIRKRIRKLEEAYGTEIGQGQDAYQNLWLASEKLIENIPESETVTNYFFDSYYRTEKGRGFMLSRKAFETVDEMPFEFFEMPVPRGYDEILKTEFGDYMTPCISYDTHNYPFYKTQLAALEELLRKSGITCPVAEFCRNWMKANRLE